MKKQLLTLTLAFASFLGYSQNIYHAADNCIVLAEDANTGVAIVNSTPNTVPDAVNMNTNVTSVLAESASKNVTFILAQPLSAGDTFKMKYYTATTGGNNIGSGRIRLRFFNSATGSATANRHQIALNNVGGSWQQIDEPLAASPDGVSTFDRVLFIPSNAAAVVETMFIDDIEGSRVNGTIPAVLSSTDATLAAGNHFYYNNSPDEFASTISAFSGATTFLAAQATPTTTGNSSATVLKVTKNEGDATTGIEFNAGPGFEINQGDGKITVRIYPECNFDYANPTLRIRARADGSGATQIQNPIANLTPNQWNEVSLDLNDVANQSGTPASSYNEVYLIFNQGDTSDTSGANPAVFYIDGLQTPSTSGVLSTNDIDAQETEINVYPNPVNGSFTISSNEAVKSVQIYSISGSLLKTFNAQPSYDISDLTSGIYFINTGSKTVKIVKN